jgi:uncharacterized protein involved in response to NO
MGFRPFFLAAAWFSVLWMGFWTGYLYAGLDASLQLPPVIRHAHEMLYGFAMAVVAGFLLTAIQNWTGLRPVTRNQLAVLFFVWLLGRAGFALPDVVPLAAISIVDLALLPLLTVAIARVLIQSRNRRNYVFLPLLMTFWLLDLVIHLDLHGVFMNAARPAMDLAVLLLATLLTFMGGRVIPFFTQNRLQATIPKRPWLDWASTLSVASLLPLYLGAGRAAPLTPLLLIAGTLTLLRMLAWRPWLTRKEPMLWILHLGYLWIPAGLLLLGLHFLLPVPWSAGVHALMAGAMGSLTLGMMSRVALGHTGRAIRAASAVTGSFLLVTLAAAARVASALYGGPDWLLFAAGLLWCAAFLAHALVYTPVLLQPRVDAA